MDRRSLVFHTLRAIAHTLGLNPALGHIADALHAVPYRRTSLGAIPTRVARRERPGASKGVVPEGAVQRLTSGHVSSPTRAADMANALNAATNGTSKVQPPFRIPRIVPVVRTCGAIPCAFNAEEGTERTPFIQAASGARPLPSPRRSRKQAQETPYKTYASLGHVVRRKR